MTAITRAQKRKAKRGRPKAMNVHREPNGRASRAGQTADIVALSARCRHLGLKLDEAKDQRAGSFLGYLFMLGRIDGLSEEQYDAAMKYQELRRSWLLAHQQPDPSRDNGVKGTSGDLVTDAYVDWVASINMRYEEARKAIQAAQDATRAENLWAAVDLVIIQEQWLYPMVGATREVCNALVRYFRT